MARLEIPLFVTNTAAGRPVGSQLAWQRKDMVIFLLHGDCPGCAQVAARLRSPPPELRDPELAVMTLLDSEQDAALMTRLRQVAGASGDRALVLIADRFLELFAALEVHGPSADQLLEDAAAWADAVQRQCGECSRMER